MSPTHTIPGEHFRDEREPTAGQGSANREVEVLRRHQVRVDVESPKRLKNAPSNKETRWKRDETGVKQELARLIREFPPSDEPRCAAPDSWIVVECLEGVVKNVRTR